MSKKSGKSGKSLADPSRLKPDDSDDKQMCESSSRPPKGSRNKCALDPDEHIFELKKGLAIRDGIFV
jgi:hypothetical protein